MTSSQPENLTLRGVELIFRLVPIRARRLAGEDPDGVAQALVAWHSDRSAFGLALSAAATVEPRVPLAEVATGFGLAPAEVDILLTALAPRVDGEFLDRLTTSPLSGRALDVDTVLSVLFATSAERFEARTLLTHGSRLVRLGLIELAALPASLSAHELEVRVPDAVANYLLGRPLLAGPLAQYCELVSPSLSWDRVVVPDDHKRLIRRLVVGEPGLQQKLDAWGFRSVFPHGGGLVLLFAGPPGTGKTAFAHAIADELDRELLVVTTSRLLATEEPLEPILADVFRVARLTGSVVLLDDCEGLIAERGARFLAVLESLDQNAGLVIMTTNLAPKIDFAMARRIQYRLDFEPPTAVMREQIWEVHLPPDAPLASDIHIPTLASTYEFTGATIRNTVLLALANLASEPGDPTLDMQRLREAAEMQLNARFDDLAVRGAHAAIGLDRLVLPEREMSELREVLSACRHHEAVLNLWGFARRLPTGRGICAMFDGPPGTGKTFTAEILASELRLPLYRVHIPQIVSKWVGETERNIAEIFVRARAARAMLLFDEADSLFGRRTQNAQTANDRYANMEVNLILQEIERYDGITILTTNLFGNLDDALQRRIQFRVTFPFPEAAERGRIWEAMMPPEAPVDAKVDYAALGRRHELAGGHIKNALLRAAYRAREDGGAITQGHLDQAAMAECRAQGKLVRAAGVRPPPPAATPAEPVAPKSGAGR